MSSLRRAFWVSSGVWTSGGSPPSDRGGMLNAIGSSRYVTPSENKNHSPLPWEKRFMYKCLPLFRGKVVSIGGCCV